MGSLEKSSLIPKTTEQKIKLLQWQWEHPWVVFPLNEDVYMIKFYKLKITRKQK